MIEVAGTIVVVTAGIFLLMLGVLALLVPDQFGKFLLAFAQTSRLHFAELALRLVVGVSFLVCWPFMQWGGVFRVVGWVLIITTLIMVLVPWQKHREFACWAVPKALSYTSAVGVCSLVMGSFVVLRSIGVNNWKQGLTMHSSRRRNWLFVQPGHKAETPESGVRVRRRC